MLIIKPIIHARKFEVVKVPITLKAHHFAQDFYELQHHAQKAQQVYLNTLAVYSVWSYLSWLGIDTTLTESDSWNPIMQTLADVADLKITNWGQVECRPVLPKVENCKFPPEVWGSRRAYVAVRLNQKLTEAKLLGFVPYVSQETINLKEFLPIQQFISYLHNANLVLLGNWLQDQIETGWEALENLLLPHQQETALQFRGTPQTGEAVGIKQAKHFTLGRKEEEIALCVGVMAKTTKEFDLSVEVYPLGHQIYLPADLKVMIIDELGEVVMQAIAKQTQHLQFEFCGEAGEQFSIKIIVGDFIIHEFFYI